MSFTPGGRKEPIEDTTAEIPLALHRQLALHVVEYADRSGLAVVETRDLLSMLGWPPDKPAG